MNVRGLALAVVCTTSILTAPARPAHAQAAPPPAAADPAELWMKDMVEAVKANLYADFVAPGDAKLKSTSRSSFALVSARFAPLLKKGYKTTFLTTLNKPDVTIHLWKLQPAGSTEDYEVRLVVKKNEAGGKVDAFSMM
jgi:hypothetical protein